MRPDILTLRCKARALARMFTRREDGWGARDSIEDSPYILAAIVRGQISVSTVRLPEEASLAAHATEPMLYGGESLWHARLKVSAAWWLYEVGNKDAETEGRSPVGRADVYSDGARWIVECGNTRFGMLKTAVMHLSRPRFTLIPYQALLRPDGKPRRLIALDFHWSEDLTRRLNDEAFERARMAADCLELDDLEDASS